jgi:hypothetical protein
MYTNTGKCPKCEKAISKVTVESVAIQGANTSYKGVSYVCQSCGCVLGVEIDPLALNADLLKKLDRD